MRNRCKHCGHWEEVHSEACRVQICPCAKYEQGDGSERPR